MTEEKKPTDWRRIGRIGAAILVGSIAAIGSYDHQRDLAIHHGQSKFIGSILPISVDLLILYATFAMDGRNRFWPRLTFWAGVGATISANVLAADHNLLSQLISAWAPVALLFVIETEAWRNRISRWRLRPAATVAASKPAEPSVAAPAPRPEPPEPAPKPRARNRRGAATEEKVRKVAAKNPTAPPAVIAAKARVSESTARRNLPAKTDDLAAELEELTKVSAGVAPAAE